MKNISKKIKETGRQCGVCEANFEIWLNNSRLPEERKEKIGERFLRYCPVCARIDEKK